MRSGKLLPSLLFALAATAAPLQRLQDITAGMQQKLLELGRAFDQDVATSEPSSTPEVLKLPSWPGGL